MPLRLKQFFSRISGFLKPKKQRLGKTLKNAKNPARRYGFLLSNVSNSESLKNANVQFGLLFKKISTDSSLTEVQKRSLIQGLKKKRKLAIEKAKRPENIVESQFEGMIASADSTMRLEQARRLSARILSDKYISRRQKDKLLEVLSKKTDFLITDLQFQK